MRIHTLWHASDPGSGDMPWLTDAVDEYTIEDNGDLPPDYKKKRADPLVRELIINIPEQAVRDLFESPEIEGVV